MTDPKGTPADLAGFFTQRSSWAWHCKSGWFGDGRDRWAWLDDAPQAFGWHTSPAAPEQVSVSAAQHPVSGIGHSYTHGREPPPANRDPAAGLFYAEQWQRALDVSPSVVFLTNWNEWIAKGYGDDHPRGKPHRFLGHDMRKGEAFFVDEYDPEFSRDLEPAAPTPANRGVADNYYYQTVANLRRYKGVRPLPPVTPKPIKIDGDFDDWHDVTPEFHDTLGDPVHRDFAGFATGTRYVNQTGRNDIAAAKVSYDADTIYFYVRTVAPITSRAGDDWMMLYIDAHHDARTGWLGYDLAVKRHALANGRTSVDRPIGTTDRWRPTGGSAAIAVAGNEMEAAVPRSLIGGSMRTLDFKWADHCHDHGDWTDFTLNGDAAPDFHFNFRAKLRP